MAARAQKRLWRKFKTAEKELVDFKKRNPGPRRGSWFDNGYAGYFGGQSQRRSDEVGYGLAQSPRERRKQLEASVREALEKLTSAICDQLKSGDLVAYTVPADLGSDYHKINPKMWERGLKLQLRTGTVTGDRFKKQKILLAHATSNKAEALQKGPGRRRHALAKEIMAEYWRSDSKRFRGLSQRSQVKLLQTWAKNNHPDVEPPAASTLRAYIQKGLFRPGPHDEHDG
ncbi:hypothetical protein [Ruegeria sediminis]|nr:hypothetical protein [Ruegeria sediminis]